MRSREAELELVARAWADLAPPLKAAILAMLEAVKDVRDPKREPK